MSFRIHYSGTLIEVDKAEELREVLLIVKNINGQMPVSLPAKQQEAPKAFKRRYRNFAQFYQSLGESRQAQMLKVLRQKPEGMTDRELCISLGIAKNIILAGTLGGIVKNARKAGFSFDEIIIREKRKGENGKRGYHYRLTDGMLQAVPGTLI